VKRSVVIIALPFSFVSKAQSFLKIIIKAGEKPLQGASVQWQQGGSSFQTDSTGLVLIQNIPAGKQTFVISHVGFEEKTTELIFPRPSDEAIEIEIEQKEDEHEEEVIIRTTRTSRTISNTSTRVEVISGEELEEKGNMKPGDIRMLLNESTGILSQQTSATSRFSKMGVTVFGSRNSNEPFEWLPLTAKHRLNNVLMFEKEGALKIGLEAYYFSPQHLRDNTTGRSYWITSLMGEKLFRKISVFINFENFTDTRQTKFGSIFNGSIGAPVFKDIYAPVEGFVVNGGFKLRL
jgi:hypothetical protein